MTAVASALVLPSSQVKELRLALVCYGGVSLAIYMHGMTKEVHNLVLASAAFDQDPWRNPFAEDRTERVWWELLSELRDRSADGTRTRVVVDVISGTSAGGINGIYLAKALATNRSQDVLRDLWFDKGDIARLLAGRRWVPAPLRFLIWGARSLVRPGKARPPLRGDQMCQWLHEALTAVDRSRHPPPGTPSLLPAGHPLRLFVPITDFHGYTREIALEEPRFVRDRTHRQLMQFHHQPGLSQFSPRYNHALAFAARATSSFPGAFPPISIDGYEQAVGGDAGLRSLAPELFPHYRLAGADPAATYFVDGGVLDNRPFLATIEAVKAMQADVEVDRRLLYLEPDPSPGEAGVPAGTPPGLPATIWGGYASIPRKEPILDDLTALARRNAVVSRVRDVIETSFDAVRERVEEIFQDALGGKARLPSGSVLLEWRSRAEKRAESDAGLGYATYLRLRSRLAVDGYARVICGILGYPLDSYHADFVTGVLRHWAGVRGLFERVPVPTDDQRAFLADLDLAYHERRIRFVIAALSWWYREVGRPGRPDRQQLDGAKHRLYEQLDVLRRVVTEVPATARVRLALDTALGPAAIRASLSTAEPVEAIVSRRSRELTTLEEGVRRHVRARLPGLERTLYADLRETSRGWDEEVKRDLLVRYLGFPLWDVLVYPVQALSEVDERDHVEVRRLSPVEAKLLARPGEEKLKGVSLGHFGAFFRRAWRESDYLWGRLDGAELLVELLFDHADEGLPRVEACRRVFEAVLAGERKLRRVKDLRQDLESRVAQLG